MWFEEFVRTWPLAEYTPLEDIVQKLKREYGAVQLEDHQIPSLWMHKFNAVHLPLNEESLHLPEDQLRIKAIMLPAAAKAQGAYDIRDSDREDVMPYLAYEEQVGYRYSNSNRLFLETDIAVGVTQKDVDTESERFHVWRKNCVAYWNMTGTAIGDVEQWKRIYPQ